MGVMTLLATAKLIHGIVLVALGILNLATLAAPPRPPLSAATLLEIKPWVRLLHLLMFIFAMAAVILTVPYVAGSQWARINYTPIAIFFVTPMLLCMLVNWRLQRYGRIV